MYTTCLDLYSSSSAFNLRASNSQWVGGATWWLATDDVACSSACLRISSSRARSVLAFWSWIRIPSRSASPVDCSCVRIVKSATMACPCCWSAQKVLSIVFLLQHWCVIRQGAVASFECRPRWYCVPQLGKTIAFWTLFCRLRGRRLQVVGHLGALVATVTDCLALPSH